MAADSDLGGRARAGVLDDVGQRLLHDLVGDHVERRRKRSWLFHADVGADSGGVDSLGEAIQIREARAAAKIGIGVAVQHPDDAAEIGERVAPAVADHRQRVIRLGRIARRDQTGGARLHDHHAHAVCDDVVEVARNPVAFLRGRLGGVETLFRTQLRSDVGETNAHVGAPGKNDAENERRNCHEQPRGNDPSGRSFDGSRDDRGTGKAEAGHQAGQESLPTRRPAPPDRVERQSDCHRRDCPVSVVRGQLVPDQPDQCRRRRRQRNPSADRHRSGENEAAGGRDAGRGIAGQRRE